MSNRIYRLEEDSVQDKFQKSRNKIQIMGGGYGNGKTTAMVAKALTIVKDYPGANILIARSTYPKLADTIQKEFINWRPKAWEEGYTKGPPADMIFKNGTEVHFRYIQQRSSGGESGTSNLLSATYDLIIVDQMEDPEIVEKDFDDLLGRLRGNTPYSGNDPTMPPTGPRWMLLACNPTRNWFYTRLVKPLKDFEETGERNDKMMVDPDTGKSIVDLFEGSTYTNAHNLGTDYIKTLEIAYQGQMRDRYLLGLWAAYEGLVYPEYDPKIHRVRHTEVERIFRRMRASGWKPTLVAGYDYGLAVPSCFILGFVDSDGNIFLVDGFYKPETSIAWQTQKIYEIMHLWNFDPDIETIFADPAIFKRGAGDKQLVGKTVAGMFADNGITMLRGNNDILNGIQKIKSYLYVSAYHRHFVTGVSGAPHIYLSDKLDWLEQELGNYYWKRDVQDDVQDRPQDKNDHALDALKYALSNEVDIATFVGKPDAPRQYMYWSEFELEQQGQGKKPRYAK